MLKALHPREKKEEMNSPAFEDCIDASIQEIEKCTNKDKERLIAVTSNSNVNKEIDKPQNIENKNVKKNNCMDSSNDQIGEMTWTWLRNGNLKEETESLH